MILATFVIRRGHEKARNLECTEGMIKSKVQWCMLSEKSFPDVVKPTDHQQ